MGRTIVFGDIHGGYKALKQLTGIPEISSAARFIFLGDYVDGWSQSFEVIDLLLALQERYDCIFIKGNHDAWCEEWLDTGYADETWLMHGGQATVASYANRSAVQKEAHLVFFKHTRNYFIDEENRLFIHAGFASQRGPRYERYSGSYSWDRTLWEMALALDGRILSDSPLYPKRLKLFREIYIGHTPTLYIGRFEPVQAANVWNIDTGAAFMGKLSALDIDSKECWQSDALYTLYEGERGRNSL